MKNIPSDKNEIPTPDLCKAFKHLKPISDYIPEPKKNVGIHLLIGRNCQEPLKVRETRNGPKQPITVVFDSSAKYNRVSLNDALLQGPDQMNSLLGILLRFRREQIAVMGDVEQVFHSFHVNKEHRDYLLFFWFKDNDPTKPVIQ
ncbi:uncharacterized protein [Ptychodera flava]|uniref:uncharacterized protein n=1 Tax=Ptychodera flava TaxID=63121 RepID=UPI00396A3B51